MTMSILLLNLQAFPAVAAYAEKILKAGIDLIPVSTGAFANEELLNRLQGNLKRQEEQNIYARGRHWRLRLHEVF